MKNFLVAGFLAVIGTAWSEEARDFTVRGVVREAVPAKSHLVVKHEEIPGYMDAMTMPFQVRDPKILMSVKAGDEITFQLHVTDKDHWIDGLKIVGASDKAPLRAKAVDIAPFKPGDPLPALTFTDERGQPIRLEVYHGKALAITFITLAAPCRISARSSPKNSAPCRNLCSPTRRHRKTGSCCR